MNLFHKIFGKNKPTSYPLQEEQSIYMPAQKIPVDELFTINFKKNGGKFLYCEDHKEALSYLNNILSEHKWAQKPLITLDPNMGIFCKKGGIKTTDKMDPQGILFTSCEYLIGQNGSILVSDTQFKEYKLHHLPERIIVFAKTSQLRETIQDGLRHIKQNYSKNIPGNITAIKNFKKQHNASQKDFLSYGSSSKDTYLILIEDL